MFSSQESQQSGSLLVPLFEADPVTPASVQGALRTFYESVTSAAPTDSVGRTVAYELAGRMWRTFQHKVERPTAAEKRRMASLCEAFILTGEALDKMEPGSPDYHDRAHGLLVMATRFMRYRAAEYYDYPLQTPQEMIEEARDFVAAVAHDLGHDGTHNSISGTYEPGALELASYAKLDPLLQKARVSFEDKQFLRNSLYGTDPGLPGDIAAFAYAAHHPTGCLTLPREKIIEKIEALPAEKRSEPLAFLEALESDERLASSVMTLKGCDMVPSYGLEQEFWVEQTRKFDRESRAAGQKPAVDEKNQPLPAGQLFVMLNFVGTELLHKNKSKPQDAALNARFMDPVLDTLFGGSLRRMQSLCTQRAGAQISQGQTKIVLGKFALQPQL